MARLKEKQVNCCLFHVTYSLRQIQNLLYVTIKLIETVDTLVNVFYYEFNYFKFQ